MTTDEIRQILDAIDRGEKLEMYAATLGLNARRRSETR